MHSLFNGTIDPVCYGTPEVNVSGGQPQSLEDDRIDKEDAHSLTQAIVHKGETCTQIHMSKNKLNLCTIRGKRLQCYFM